MQVEIVKGFPPNYQLIKQAVNPPKDSFFPWGDKIYNPSGVEIPPDIQYHEEIHLKQQKEFGSPMLWWQKWIIDIEFRKHQEVQAFSEQIEFIKSYYPAKAVKEALDECADKLADNYRLDITNHQAKTLIRKYGL